MRHPRISPWDIEYLGRRRPGPLETAFHEYRRLGCPPVWARRIERTTRNTLRGAMIAAAASLVVVSVMVAAARLAQGTNTDAMSAILTVLVILSPVVYLSARSAFNACRVLRSAEAVGAVAHPALCTARVRRLRPFARARRRGADAHLAAELARRIEAWRDIPANMVACGSYEVQTRPWVTLLRLSAAVAVVAVGGWLPHVAMLVVIALLLPLVSLPAYMRFVRGLSGALQRGECPQCGLGLAGVTPALATVPAAGPERCPECASPWPLVPPPVN